MKAPSLKQLKLVGVITLVILTIVLIVQNTEAVETKILFVSVSMPRAVLLLVTLLVGMILGMVLASRLSSPKMKKKTSKPEREDSTPAESTKEN